MSTSRPPVPAAILGLLLLAPVLAAGACCGDDSSAVRTRWAMLDLGVNVLTADGGLRLPPEAEPFEDLRYGSSFNLDMHVFKQRVALGSPAVGLEYGLTFGWYNYSFQEDLVPRPDRERFTLEASENPLRKSGISMTYFALPAAITVETRPSDRTHSFRLSAGFSGGVRIASKSRVRTREGLRIGVRDDFNLARFRYGPFVRIGYGWFNLYGAYAMSPFFEEGQGPVLHAATVGFALRVP